MATPRAQPWLVEITYEPFENAQDWSWQELEDLAEQYGEDTEEYNEAVGPTPGYMPTRSVGPYTERQAHALVARLNDPEIKRQLGIIAVVALHLNRFDVEFELKLAKSSQQREGSK